MQLVATAVVGLWLTPGCSFVFLDRVPHDYSEGDHVECTTSSALPAVDTVFAILHVTSLAYLAEHEKGSNADNLESLDLSWALFFGASAIYGYYETSQCEQARRARGSGLLPAPQAPIHSGFGEQTTARQALGGRDLSGAFALVTAGHAAIGLETTRALRQDPALKECLELLEHEPRQLGLGAAAHLGQERAPVRWTVL